MITFLTKQTIRNKVVDLDRVDLQIFKDFSGLSECPLSKTSLTGITAPQVEDLTWMLWGGNADAEKEMNVRLASPPVS